MNTRRWMLGLAVVALGIMFGQLAQAGGDKKDTTMSLQGKAAPDFTLKTLDGKEVKLSDQKGSVVMMDFWATWCPPCRKSLPHVQEMSADKELAAKGLKVWAVNAHEQTDNELPNIGYATVYPIAIIGKILLAQLLLTILSNY